LVAELPAQRAAVLELVDDAVRAVGARAGGAHGEREPGQWKYWPPSMTIVCPVRKVDSGPHRKATAPTTSSGTWSRLMVRALTAPACRASMTSGCSLTPALMVKPGATRLTSTWWGPSSLAGARVSATIAPLLVT